MEHDAGRERQNTYHDQWYLVEELTPSLRPEVIIRRQYYWGTPWYILSEPDNNAHFRLAQGGYAFVCMLDGNRTVQEVWELCQESWDDALTQGEVIALLGQLHSAHLLRLDMPTDAENLLQRRQEKRLKKLGSTLSSFLFLRIPLGSPDAFFSRWQRYGNLLFRPVGFACWLLLLMLALRALLLNWDMFALEARHSLSPSNLPWLYVVIVLAKAVHECGHAFACKYFTAKDGLEGDLHTMGIMLLLFAPVPYIDVSSSAPIRSKWRRAAIGLGGVYSELFLAFVAMLVWAGTAPDTSLHLLARNCVVITSVTTLLFNINPLLRFDGYFVLSDLLGMPNLYQRSQSYVIYLVKRFVLGLAKAHTVVHRRNEKILYPIFATAAFFYRILITVSIYFILEQDFASLGAVLAFGLFFIWFGLPMIKGGAYLVNSPELAGTRERAVLRFGAAVFVIAFLLLGVPVESAITVEGVVESRDLKLIFAEEEGTLVSYAPTDSAVGEGSSEIAFIDNPGLMAEYERMQLTVAVDKAKLEYAREQGDVDAAGMHARQYQAALQQLDILRMRVNKQIVYSPVDGVWVAPELARRHGEWIGKGDMLGAIYSPEKLRLRTVVDQFDAARLFAEPILRSEFCVSDRMDVRDKNNDLYVAVPEGKPTPAGRRDLIHPSLSMNAGGGIATVAQQDGGEVARHHFFELRLIPDEQSATMLSPGARVLVRLVFGQSPLGMQWLRRFQQYFTTR